MEEDIKKMALSIYEYEQVTKTNPRTLAQVQRDCIIGTGLERSLIKEYDILTLNDVEFDHSNKDSYNFDLWLDHKYKCEVKRYNFEKNPDWLNFNLNVTWRDLNHGFINLSTMFKNINDIDYILFADFDTDLRAQLTGKIDITNRDNKKLLKTMVTKSNLENCSSHYFVVKEIIEAKLLNIDSISLFTFSENNI